MASSKAGEGANVKKNILDEYEKIIEGLKNVRGRFAMFAQSNKSDALLLEDRDKLIRANCFYTALRILDEEVGEDNDNFI